MIKKLYFLKPFILMLVFLCGYNYMAKSQIAGDISFITTHDRDIGTGHNNTDQGYKTQIRLANTTLDNPASYDGYLKFNVKDSIEIPDGMKILLDSKNLLARLQEDVARKEST